MVFILTTPVTALQLLQRTKAELTSSTKLSEVSCSRCCAFSGLVLHIRQLCFPDNCAPITGAVPAMKPEADAIGDLQDGRWKITLMFDGCRFCIPKFGSSTLQQTTRQWRHWWFPTMSSFRVTNHSEAHTHLTALFPGPRWASTRKVKSIWILLKQDTVSGSGTSWAICKSAPRPRQTTRRAPHFYRPDALSVAQPTVSKHKIQ